MNLENSLEVFLERHPRKGNVKFTYGTAGYRMKAKDLDYVNFTVGILAALRSKFYKGKSTGVMITASHNPPEDNGVKVVEPLGTMLEVTWEAHAMSLSNASHEELPGKIKQLCSDLGIDLSAKSNVIIGRDTRESSLALSEATIDGIKSIPGSTCQNFGVLTTPQLHYITRCTNDNRFGEPTISGYYSKLATSYKVIEAFCDKEEVEVNVDCANGVGAVATQGLSNYLSGSLKFCLSNDKWKDPSVLNVECGADFVKTTQSLPSGIDILPEKLYSSYDGDADRLICYYLNSDKEFCMLDGDKIATLYACFFQKLLENVDQNKLELNIGVIQTAYANGASTKYISDHLKIPVSCVPTGVKHLHAKAEEFDIGIYFEANGHGTVLFSDDAEKRLKSYKTSNEKEAESIAVLIGFSNLINQTVGDAVSDLLAVIVACKYLGFTPQDWNSLYQELPNHLVKHVVADKSIYLTINAERTLSAPVGLQEKIDECTKKFKDARCFVRPSGTEDVVRIYAEADTKEHCLELSNVVASYLK